VDGSLEGDQSVDDAEEALEEAAGILESPVDATAFDATAFDATAFDATAFDAVPDGCLGEQPTLDSIPRQTKLMHNTRGLSMIERTPTEAVKASEQTEADSQGKGGLSIPN
jgi:hypothetical protein